MMLFFWTNWCWFLVDVVVIVVVAAAVLAFDIAIDINNRVKPNFS